MNYIPDNTETTVGMGTTEQHLLPGSRYAWQTQARSAARFDTRLVASNYLDGITTR